MNVQVASTIASTINMAAIGMMAVVWRRYNGEITAEMITAFAITMKAMSLIQKPLLRLSPHTVFKVFITAQYAKVVIMISFSFVEVSLEVFMVAAFIAEAVLVTMWKSFNGALLAYVAEVECADIREYKANKATFVAVSSIVALLVGGYMSSGDIPRVSFKMILLIASVFSMTKIPTDVVMYRSFKKFHSK